MKYIKWILLAVTLAAAPGAASAQAVLTERTLSIAAAMEAATAALEQCRKDGHRVVVTVIDHAARNKVVLSEDGVRPHAFEHAYRKAFTALTYRTPSVEYGKRAAANFPASVGGLNLSHITTAGGGLPIRAGKDVIGAIGISGSAGSQGISGGVFDDKCAQAGIDRIAAGLGG
jgi:uncharacterized protein GlcG (DUF336 family)